MNTTYKICFGLLVVIVLSTVAFMGVTAWHLNDREATVHNALRQSAQYCFDMRQMDREDPDAALFRCIQNTCRAGGRDLTTCFRP